MKRAHSGMTLVETLVAIGILTLVTGIITTFLTAQWRLADQTEARNEMQVNLRSALEMISTDLNSAGSQGVQASCNSDSVKPALEVGGNPRKHKLTVRYCDPYKNSPTPQTISYELRRDDNNSNVWTLYRKVDDANFQPAVPGIRAFELDFACTPSVPTCGATNPGGVLSATVKLTGQSVHKTRGVSSPFMFDGSRFTNQEEAGHYYEYAEQTVSPPNLGP